MLASTTYFDVKKLRQEFPVLQRMVHGNKPLVYLDNAATTQRPQSVIDAQVGYLTQTHSNVHRGGHALAAEATALYEAARQRVADFLGAPSSSNIVFTKGTTESINLVASAWGNQNVSRGDEIIVTEMEHHAVIVPLQMLCERVGATLKVIPVLDNGTLNYDSISKLITDNTRLIAFTHVSNALGTINDVKRICELARERGIVTLVDGAQAVAHLKITDPSSPFTIHHSPFDFYAFSAHKLYGPTGVGVLYGRAEILESMQPYQGGGSMISSVSFEKTTYNDVPYRFEAGTPNIEGVVGMGAAIEWYRKLDHDALAEHEKSLLEHATNELLEIEGLRILGDAEHKIGVISFVVDGIHANDIGMLCDEQGVALRVGHHCTMPLMKKMGVNATARASFAAYTTHEEIDALIKSVKKATGMLR